MVTVYCLSGLSFLISAVALLVVVKKKKIFNWEYYKDGIRIYNKKNKVTIETEKSLK